MSSKKKSAKKTNSHSSTKKPTAVKKGPRQKQLQLPGMEDRAIAALDDAAATYAEARDARIQAGTVEQAQKKVLLGVMHASKKTRYVHGDVYVEIIPEGEKLKVKILKEGEEAPEAKGEDVTVNLNDEPVESEGEDIPF